MPDPVTSYCSVGQLEALGMRAEALAKFSPEAKQAALDAGRSFIDGYLARYSLPLIGFGLDITRACAIIAAFDLLSVKGLNPDNSSDKNVIDRYRDTLAWLKLVAQGTVVPSGILDSGAGAISGIASAGRPRMVSGESRGFSVRGTAAEFYRGPFQTG